MIDLKMGPVTANLSELVRELRAAIPDVTGTSGDPEGNLIVHIEAEDPTGMRAAVEAVIAAHDPAKLTAEQKETAARETVRTTLAAADFAVWVTAVKNASTLAAMKVLLLQLGRVVWMLAKAQGLTSTTDPGE